MLRVFRDRHDAGAQLARALHHYSEAADAVVIAHTRSSVPVAYEVATRLALPLDLIEHAEPGCLARGSQHDIANIDALDELDIRDKTVLLVDDGDAGREMELAIERLRELGAASIVAGVGVASPAVYEMLHAAADHIACVLTPQRLFSIEAWYADLAEPSEEDIRQLLMAAAQNLVALRRSNSLSRTIDT